MFIGQLLLLLLLLLNGFDFYFDLIFKWRDTENQKLMAGPSSGSSSFLTLTS